MAISVGAGRRRRKSPAPTRRQMLTPVSGLARPLRAMRADRRPEPVRFPCATSPERAISRPEGRASGLARLPGRARHRPRPRLVRLLRRVELHRPAARPAPHDRHDPGGLPGGGADRLRRLPGGRRAARRCRPAACCWPCWRAWATAAGLIGFYKAAELGPLSIVAPIGATGAIVPVAYGLATGDTLKATQVAGVVLAMAGAALAARARAAGAAGAGALPRSARERDLGARLGRGLRRLPHRPPEGVGGRPRVGAVRRAAGAARAARCCGRAAASAASGPRATSR